MCFKNLSGKMRGCRSKFRPQAEVDALVYADTAPMLEGHPELAQLHLIDRGWKRQGVWRQGAVEWALISALRARHYDLVVHLSVHTRGAWLVRLLRPRWSVAPKYTEGFWARSFTHLYPAQLAASSMFIPPRAGPSSAGPRRASPRCATPWRQKACR